MKINMEMINIFKKPYVWAFLAALNNVVVLLCWLCGVELGGTVIFCVIASAIVGNWNAAITSLRSEIDGIDTMASLRKQIRDVIDKIPFEEDSEAP